MPVVVTNLRSSTDGTEPYLESLDASTSGEVVALEWASYLVDSFGVAGAVRALQYYEDVGWISRSVRRAMVDHVQSSPEADHGDGPTGTPSEAMESLDGTPFEDHARSLEYVAAIGDDGLAAELQALRLPATADLAAGAGEAPADGTGPVETTADSTDPAEAPSGLVEPDSDSAEPETVSDSTPDADPSTTDGDDTDEDATETADAATDPSEPDAATAVAAEEQAGVAGSLADAETFHLLAAGGDRSRCGMLDTGSETTPDVAETLPREEARAAGLSLCIHCGDSDGE